MPSEFNGFAMKRLLLLKVTSAIFTILVIIAPTPGQVQKAKGLSTTDAVLTASAKESSVKSGNAIWVDVTVENRSDHELLVGRERVGPEGDQGGHIYYVDVRDDKGGKPQPTKFLEKKSYLGSGALIYLKPGKTMTDRINVCKLFDLSRPGKYNIRVYRKDTGDMTPLTANIVTVTVTP